MNQFGKDSAEHAAEYIGVVKGTWPLVLIAGAVAFIGTVSFVGLVAPHIAKMLLGEDQRFLLPGTLLSGALLMVLSSLFAKLISAGAIIPVGIITSLVGVPFLLALLVRYSSGRSQ